MSDVELVQRLQSIFPGLKAASFQITSPVTPRYNCIAWAVGNNNDWWWPDPLDTSYWPSQIPREPTLVSFLAMFGRLGFEVCAGQEFEPGYEKVAIFARDSVPTHAARQLVSGSWTSKLGEAVDIEHELAAIEGDLYGRVAYVLKRLAPEPAKSLT